MVFQMNNDGIKHRIIELSIFYDDDNGFSIRARGNISGPIVNTSYEYIKDKNRKPTISFKNARLFMPSLSPDERMDLAIDIKRRIKIALIDKLSQIPNDLVVI